MTFNTGSKRGLQKQVVTVESNDPVNPNVRVNVTANIEVLFGFGIMVLDFGNVHKNRASSKVVYLEAVDPASLVLDKLSSSSDHITSRVIEQSGTNTAMDRTAVEVTVHPGLPVGRFSETIRAKSKVDTLPEASIPVTGTIIGDVVVSPETIRFLVKTSADNSVMPHHHRLRITNHSDAHGIRITGFRDPDGRMEFELNAVQEGWVFDLTIRPRNTGGITGEVSGLIIISTDHPDQKELKVGYMLTPQS